MMFPKPKHRTKKSPQKIADTYFSLLIRARTCCEANNKDHVSCGGPLQCAHIISRTNKRLRYDENNALCLCAGHHRYYTTQPHQWFWDFIPNKFPKQYQYVQFHRNDIVKNNAGRLNEIVAALDQKLTAMEITH